MTESGEHGIVVMYHYVRDREQKHETGLRPLWIDEFEYQLDWLSDRYTILTPEQIGAMCEGSYAPTRPYCILTFDDGTKDHAIEVTALLSRRELGGIFFVLTGPLVDQRLPNSHRLHVLLSRVSETSLWREVVNLVGGESRLGQPCAARRSYGYEDSDIRRRLKYGLNRFLSRQEADRVLGELIATYVGEESLLVKEWFVTEADLHQMQVAGMEIGSHGHCHEAISNLSQKSVENDIRQCHLILSDILGRSPRMFAYPFGGYGASQSIYNRCNSVFRELRYRGIFTYDRDNRPFPFRSKVAISHFGRVDCTELPPRTEGSLF